ncbi:MAG: hypothetical protein KIT83_08595 [Bryobacterales bacterium]|nr:hypothetical protein [Bryobacterales bacterium]
MTPDDLAGLSLPGDAMSDIGNFAVWSVVAGVIAGVAFHATIRGVSRRNIVGMLLAFGLMTLVLVALVTATGMTGRIERRAWNYAILGFPMVVAGIVMLALGRIWKLPARRKRAARRITKAPGE